MFEASFSFSGAKFVKKVDFRGKTYIVVKIVKSLFFTENKHGEEARTNKATALSTVYASLCSPRFYARQSLPKNNLRGSHSVTIIL